MNLALAHILILTFAFGYRPALAQSNRFGISRIVPGWTNYSTAFSMTHDADASGEFATVGSLYTPAVDAGLREFAAIVIWFGQDEMTSDFSDFSFEVMLWSGLAAFIADPRHGDLATYAFSQPTGSTTNRDTTTRGGRAAYLLRFTLPTSASITLTQCHTYVVGLAATAASSQAGEFFVPTAPFDGDSDVQAGNIVPFGWTYLVNSGGMTIYSGQLSTELRVEALGEAPRLHISRDTADLIVTPLPEAPCYRLEIAETLAPAAWLPFTDPPTSSGTGFFRLVRENPSRFIR
jgi:hypothetical protein